MEREKGKETGWMVVEAGWGGCGGGGVFCSKRYVSIRERRWVIRDLEDCYRGRRFIPAELRLLEWKSEDGRKMNVGLGGGLGGGGGVRSAATLLYMMYCCCTITRCRIGDICSAITENPVSPFPLVRNSAAL